MRAFMESHLPSASHSLRFAARSPDWVSRGAFRKEAGLKGRRGARGKGGAAAERLEGCVLLIRRIGGNPPRFQLLKRESRTKYAGSWMEFCVA